MEINENIKNNEQYNERKEKTNAIKYNKCKNKLNTLRTKRQ